jgi:predicted nucleic acid-binding protein
MIIVDSSVWIDWFRQIETPQTITLRASPPREILIGDVVLLEVLRGARDERQARVIQDNLGEFSAAEMLNSELAAKGAANYRRLRSLGVTIRTTADLIIGTFCIEHDHVLLHADRDFQPMQQHLGLRCL